jgi:hypothetical protein
MSLFRTLNDVEEQQFRKWARQNYKPMEQINGCWHPITQAECVKMNAEHAGLKADSDGSYAKLQQAAREWLGLA